MDGTHDCMSTTDSKTGWNMQQMCQCTETASPKLYCGLHGGDSPMQKVMSSMMSWQMSSEINKCNTMARYLPSVCAQNNWGTSKVNDYIYYTLYASLYVKLQGASSCVYKALHADYTIYKSSHGSGAEFLAVSAFVIALFA